MIELKHIVKEYNQKVVLNDICLTIEQGQSVAFTGHNGCGKSTLLKVISGLVRPTKGTVFLEKGKLIHYVPEHFPQMNLTAKQYLFYMGKLEAPLHKEASHQIKASHHMGTLPHMKNLRGVELKSYIHELAEEFFVSNMLDIPMKYLSKGSLQKIGVMQALLKEPDILLLDEPLSGQDVMSQQVFIQKIQELQKHNVTILMSCHEPYLVDAVADEVYQFNDGKIFLANHRLADEVRWYRMFFVRTKEADIPENWKGRLQFTEQGCILRAEESECDRAMAEMLEAGWNLRGMRMEKEHSKEEKHSMEEGAFQ